MLSCTSIFRWRTREILEEVRERVTMRRVEFVRGKPGNFPSLDLTFPPTGLSKNLGGMERGRGKGKGKGGGDHLPYFSPHWLLPQIPPCRCVSSIRDIGKLNKL